jgi:hypothetical protein
MFVANKHFPLNVLGHHWVFFSCSRPHTQYQSSMFFYTPSGCLFATDAVFMCAPAAAASNHCLKAGKEKGTCTPPATVPKQADALNLIRTKNNNNKYQRLLTCGPGRESSSAVRPRCSVMSCPPPPTPVAAGACEPNQILSTRKISM